MQFILFIIKLSVRHFQLKRSTRHLIAKTPLFITSFPLHMKVSSS